MVRREERTETREEERRRSGGGGGQGEEEGGRRKVIEVGGRMWRMWGWGENVRGEGGEGSVGEKMRGKEEE